MDQTTERRAENLKNHIGILKARYNGALRFRKGDHKLIEKVAAFKKQSGLRNKQCAEVLGIKPYQMGYLLVRANEKQEKSSSQKMKFREIKMGNPTPKENIEVILPSGIKARFQSVKASAEFARAF